MEIERAPSAERNRFAIFDLLLATSLAAGPLAFQSQTGWKPAISLMTMAVAMTILRTCKRNVMRAFLTPIAVLTGASIAATCDSMWGLALSFSWLLVVVVVPMMLKPAR